MQIPRRERDGRGVQIPIEGRERGWEGDVET